MALQKALLEKFGEELVRKYRASIDSVSGKTADSIHAVATDTELDIRGASYIFALEYGRGPTREGALNGNPTLFEAIKQWALLKGVIKDLDSKASLGIVAAITRKIHKEGTKLYRSGKPSGVLSRVTDTINMTSLLKDLTILNVKEYNSEVLRNLKKLS